MRSRVEKSVRVKDWGRAQSRVEWGPMPTAEIALVELPRSPHTECAETDLILPSAADFRGSLVRSRLVALDDGGVRREYGGGRAGLLNLSPLDVKAIAQPKRGDVALDDGSNTSGKKPAIAIFDGKQWIFR